MDKHVIKSDWLQETVFHGTLPSGLEVFVMPKPGFSKQYATFSTHYGSVDNKFGLAGQVLEVPDGIAHFLEHKLFEEEQGNVFDEFAKLGANTNAFTSWTNTSYLFSSTENFYPALETLLNFVQQPYFTEENVEKEKGIIEQEIRMYQDSPHWRGFFNLLNALFHQHPVKIDIAGTVDSIRKISPEILFKCYYTFYHPSNMALFATGDLDPERVFSQVEDNLARRNYTHQEKIERIYPKEPETVKTREVETKLSVSRPSIYLGFKDKRVGFGGRELLEKEVATEIILDSVFGKGSDLYDKLYQSGLIDENFTTEFMGSTTYGASVVGGETKDPAELQGEIEKEIGRIRQEGLNTAALDRSRRKLLGRFIKGFNSLEFVANNFLNYHFLGSSLFEYPEVLQGISINTLKERFDEHFNLEQMAVSKISAK